MSKGAFEEVRASEDSEAHLQQIRSILFGQHMHELERKMQALEQQLQEQTARLNQELLDRVSVLENRLAGLLSQEAEERQIADQAL